LRLLCKITEGCAKLRVAYCNLVFYLPDYGFIRTELALGVPRADVLLRMGCFIAFTEQAGMPVIQCLSVQFYSFGSIFWRLTTG